MSYLMNYHFNKDHFLPSKLLHNVSQKIIQALHNNCVLFMEFPLSMLHSNRNFLLLLNIGSFLLLHLIFLVEPYHKISRFNSLTGSPQRHDLSISFGHIVSLTSSQTIIVRITSRIV